MNLNINTMATTKKTFTVMSEFGVLEGVYTSKAEALKARDEAGQGYFIQIGFK